MHLLARFVLCLVVGLPALGSAQAKDAPTASPMAPTPPPLVTAPTEPDLSPAPGEIIPRRLPSRSDSGLVIPRILLGSVLGTVVGAGGGIGGFLIGTQLSKCDLFDGPCNDPFSIIVPTLVGLGTFSSLTTFAVGTLFGGRGSFLHTLIGGFAGTGISLLAVAVAGYGGILVMPLLATTGALIAYEVSDSHQVPELEPVARADTGFRVVPVLGATQGGGILGGLRGSF